MDFVIFWHCKEQVPCVRLNTKHFIWVKYQKHKFSKESNQKKKNRNIQTLSRRGIWCCECWSDRTIRNWWSKWRIIWTIFRLKFIEIITQTRIHKESVWRYKWERIRFIQMITSEPPNPLSLSLSLFLPFFLSFFLSHFPYFFNFFFLMENLLFCFLFIFPHSSLFSLLFLFSSFSLLFLITFGKSCLILCTKDDLCSRSDVWGIVHKLTKIGDIFPIDPTWPTCNNLFFK